MGVPGLFGHYYRKFKKEKELLNSVYNLTNKVEYLFFDFNSLIHPCAYQILEVNDDKYLCILDEEERTNVIEFYIIQNCINYTRLIIDIINPKQVFIMIDGVAPRSKMNQQRERRYKSHFFKELEINKSVLWDSNKITPGTEFMEKLTKELHLQFPDSTISDSNEPGEGEHKMMKILSDTTEINGNILIYGLDADLIMLSMMNKCSDKIILIRDSEFGDIDNISYLNIKQLKDFIFQDFKYKFKYEIKQDFFGTIDQFINDYILLCFLLGNDFLDHIFCLYIKDNSIDIITKAYIKAFNGTSLVNKIGKLEEWINFKFLKDIFYQLKNYEEYYLKQNKNTYPIKGITTEQIEKYNNDSYSNLYFYHNNLNTNDKNFKTQYNNFYNIQDTSNVCFNYIEGLQWVLGYYNGHVHNNWSWYYKYHNVPFCNDIFNYLNKNKNFNSICIKIKSDTPFNSFNQLCLVLPKYSFKNIITNTNILNADRVSGQDNLILNNNDIFPSKLYVDLHYKDFLWQSKIIFHDINENIIDLYKNF